MSSGVKKSGSALGPGRASTSQAFSAPTSMSQVRLRHGGGHRGVTESLGEWGGGGKGVPDFGGAGGRGFSVWRNGDEPHGPRQGFCLPGALRPISTSMGTWG